MPPEVTPEMIATAFSLWMNSLSPAMRAPVNAQANAYYIQHLTQAMREAIAILEEEELADVQNSPAERAYGVLVRALRGGS